LAKPRSEECRAPKPKFGWKLSAKRPISAAIALALLAQSLLVEAGAPQLSALTATDALADYYAIATA